ncbi:hypothetical protein IWZ01DRAFT_223141 [Phyllosticta capitalensis]
MLSSLTLHQYSTCILRIPRSALSNEPRFFHHHARTTNHPPLHHRRSFLALPNSAIIHISTLVPCRSRQSRADQVASLVFSTLSSTVATDFNHWNHHESTTLDPRICNLTNSVTRRSRPLRPAPSFRSVVRRDPIAKNFARVCRSDCYARNRHHPPPRSPSCDPLAGARSA